MDDQLDPIDLVDRSEDERGPILRPSLHDAIVSRVRDLIIQGVLEPGARVHEGKLGLELGVSRTPLREALKFLASEGLIELVQGRGALVRRFTPKDVHDSLVVLGALEGLAGRLACENATHDEIKSVRELHDRMIELYRARDRLPYFKLNQAIHSKLVEIARNEPLLHVHSQIQARLKRIRYIGHEGPEKWRGAVEDHERIMAALETRDPDRTAQALTAHMLGAWERVRDGL